MSDWKRVSKARPCPVCGKVDWCGYVGPDDAPEAAICSRVESPNRRGSAGWLHRLRDDQTGPPIRRRIVQPRPLAAEPTPDLQREVIAGQLWTDENPTRFAGFADHLGLSVASLQRLNVGYSPRRRAWLFPMRSAAGAVCGVRLRLHDGRKLAIRGGREGLFVPQGVSGNGLLCICEGPTDCAALLDMGLPAIGRPSCRGGVDHLRELVGRLRPDQVAIVADDDEPGQDGAHGLAKHLAAYCRDVRIIQPPHGVKDARAWRAAGATTADVLAAIDAAEPWRLAITTRAKGVAHA